MNEPEKNEPTPIPAEHRKRSVLAIRPSWWIMLLFIGVLAVLMYLPSRSVSQISYDFFIEQIQVKNVVKVDIQSDTATGKFLVAPKDPKLLPQTQSESENDDSNFASSEDRSKSKFPRLSERFRVTLPANDQIRDTLNKELLSHSVRVNYHTSGSALYLYYGLMLLFPVGILVWMWISMRRARDPLSSGGFLSGFSRSQAKQFEASSQTTGFDDVAGIESVKAELLEIIDFLTSPEKFQKLGGRVPKGVLLSGSPGTGKTLLARAVAGEAGVPFFSVNGSEFIQMFVGVGASRVRDLFNTAKGQSPAIIFIDEIDAVGRQRGAGVGGGHDEREQTLNQILSEMDGFSPADSVIVIAATNRPDVLDPALLRPGRFDRLLTVERPTRKGRLAIFKVHVRDVPLADDVDLPILADGAVGLSGADIRNIVNEAALWAARNDKTRVEMADFEYARDKVLMGPKREEVLNEDDKKRTAYHEAAHTIVAWKLKSGCRVHKVSIIPRGRALGATQVLPVEDRPNITRSEILDRLVMLLAGRAAERLVFQEITAGAENDLERATDLARRMITHWGMSDAIGPISIKLSEDDPFLGREMQRPRIVSDDTLQRIDAEVKKWLTAADERAMELLEQWRPSLDELVVALLVEEELTEKEIAVVLGAPHWELEPDATAETVSGNEAEVIAKEPESGFSAKKDQGPDA